MEKVTVTELVGPREGENHIVDWYEVPRVPVVGEHMVVRDSEGVRVEVEVEGVIFETLHKEGREMTAAVAVRRIPTEFQVEFS